MGRNERFREEWTEYTCDNGLKLVLFQKAQFHTSAFLLMTPFGNLDTMQETADGTVFTSPSGTAHFLEHKLFESDSEDIMMKFNRLGANVNASTSYDMTSYFFTTPSEDIRTPLNLLLDFVQDLSITDASVLKEQKIILEELAMYQQDPDSRLFNETMRAVYSYHPIRDDIVGTEASIASITKGELTEAYLRNYHPSRMTLIGVTSESPEHIIALVEENQRSRPFWPMVPAVRRLPVEPLETAEQNMTIAMAIEHPRCSVCFKLPVTNETDAERMKREWALRLSLEAVFSPLNPSFQNWIDEGRITSYFGYDIECSADCFFLYFQDESADSEGIYQFVRSQLENMKVVPIGEQELSQMKRRMLGTIIRVMDNPMDMIGSWSRSVIRKVSIFEECEIVESLDPEFCLQAFRELSISHYSCVKLVPQSESA